MAGCCAAAVRVRGSRTPNTRMPGKMRRSLSAILHEACLFPQAAMNSTLLADDNPFDDPAPGVQAHANEEVNFVADSTLAVGRDATLTLGTDALIVLDETYVKRDTRNCCGAWATGSTNTRAIPFYNILWAELAGGDIVISYALPTSHGAVRATDLTYSTEGNEELQVNSWITKLLDRSYGEAQRRKRAKVLVNPHAGQGSAEKWYHRDVEPILKAAKCSFDTVKTKFGGEASEIAEKLDIDSYDMIVTCSGDGLAHLVFNGLGKRPDAKRALGKIAVTHVPCGSGNAMSCNLNGNAASPSLATLAIIKGIVTPLDLISITQGNSRTLSFLSQSLGIVAESDLATEHLRWMGSARFTYGFLVRLLRKTVYPCDIAIRIVVEDKPSLKEHYKTEVANHAPASERRGDRNLHLEDDASASSSNDEGLPALKYGTINDKLPPDWEMVSYNKLGNFYCGNMAYMSTDANFFAAALPNDGYMDLITIDGDLSCLSSINLLTSVGNETKFFDMPQVHYRKILGYRIIPKQKGDGYISIDGERVPFEPYQAEVHRGLGTVLSKTGHIYEAKGPVL